MLIRCLLILLLGCAQALACGPDPAPPQAAAVGFTCETFNEGNPWSLSTIDINNTQAPGFNWYVNLQFPNPAQNDWKTLGINSPGDFSISSGKLVFHPTAMTSLGGGSTHVGFMMTCNQASASLPMQGTVFTGGMYWEVQASWPNGTAADSTATGWPIAWTWPVDFLQAGTAGGFNWSEMDLFEAPFRQNYHLWTSAPGGNPASGVLGSCTSCPAVPASGGTFGMLLVPAALNGGTDAFKYYLNNTLQQNIPPPGSFTAAQSFGLSVKERTCLLLGGGFTNPATFGTVRVWQVPPTGASGKVFKRGTNPVGGGGHPSSPTGTCPQSTSFFTRVWALPATLDGAVGVSGHLKAYDDMICGLVNDGVWPTLDAFWMMATDTATGTNTSVANMNLVSPNFTLTPHGPPPFTANGGYTGVDSSGSFYLDTGYNPATAGGNLTLNSAHITSWLLQGLQASSTGGETIAALSSTNMLGIIVWFSDNNSYGYLNTQTSSAVFAAAGQSIGGWTAVRTAASGSGAQNMYFNGAPFANSAFASTGLPAVNLYLLARNNGGTADGGSGRLQAMNAVGSGLSGTQATALYTRVCAYLTAVHGSC